MGKVDPDCDEQAPGVAPGSDGGVGHVTTAPAPLVAGTLWSGGTSRVSLRLVPLRLAPVKVAPVRVTPVRSAPGRVAPARLARVRVPPP